MHSSSDFYESAVQFATLARTAITPNQQQAFVPKSPANSAAILAAYEASAVPMTAFLAVMPGQASYTAAGPGSLDTLLAVVRKQRNGRRRRDSLRQASSIRDLGAM